MVWLMLECRIPFLRLSQPLLVCMVLPLTFLFSFCELVILYGLEVLCHQQSISRTVYNNTVQRLEDPHPVPVISTLPRSLVAYPREFGPSPLSVSLIDISFSDVYHFCELASFLSDPLKLMFSTTALREPTKEKPKCGNGVFTTRLQYVCEK